MDLPPCQALDLTVNTANIGESNDCPDEQAALALDRAIDALRSGCLDESHDLANRFPELHGAVELIRDLLPDVNGQAAQPTEACLLADQTTFGPYRLEGEIGAGSFGAVYRVYDPGLKRAAALKILYPSRLAQPEALARFYREARATARLNHPAIVRLFDYSREGPPFYLVTELVEGVDLREWREIHGLPAAEACELVARIAEAMDYAHAHGVYHRDLKPANILIDNQGNPHILDFGLARLGRDAADSTGAATADGDVVGTLAYMAPEQAAGHSHQADARSDVYSLGVILYELLTGVPPFRGPLPALASQVIEGSPPPLRSMDPALHRDLEAICHKALSKRPEDRYLSSAALARDLRAHLRGEPLLARRRNWVDRTLGTLNRQHQIMLAHDWRKLLIAQGLIIFAGCLIANMWLILPSTRQLWWPIPATKSVQIATMLFVLYLFRPVGAQRLPPGQRNIWVLIPAYYGALLTVLSVNWLAGSSIPLAPVLLIMSGMAFVTLGSTIWGWLYVFGAGFFLLAIVVTASGTDLGLGLLGLAWCICLVITGWKFRRPPGNTLSSSGQLSLGERTASGSRDIEQSSDVLR